MSRPARLLLRLRRRRLPLRRPRRLPAEPEDKSVSYADYLAQQAEKKLALASALEARKANEGSKPNKQWENATALVKDEDADFIASTGSKAKRERERKTKQLLDIDQRYVEPERPRGGARGGRGGGRGDAFRGASRGDSSRGAGRGRGGGRGDFRGDSSRGDSSRGDFRGGRGGRETAPLNPNDASAFPSLGS